MFFQRDHEPNASLGELFPWLDDDQRYNRLSSLAEEVKLTLVGQEDSVDALVRHALANPDEMLDRAIGHLSLTLAADAVATGAYVFLQ